jgi:ketosteroid isomerase-like protein
VNQPFRLIATGVLAVAAASAVLLAVSASSNGSDEETIVASEHAWALAPVKGDAAGMAALMSDDYVEIEMETTPGSSKSKWVTAGKAEWVEMVRSGREKYTSVDVRNIKVYLHGDLATTTGEYSQTGTKDGKDISATGLYVDTWVKKNGKWLVVSSVFP